MAEGGSGGPRAGDGLAVAGVAAFAVVCCAALPVLLALAGGVAIGTVLGVGAGVLATVGLVALVVARKRRARQRGDPSPTGESHGPAPGS